MKFRLPVAIALSLISITACGRSSAPPATSGTPAQEAAAAAKPGASASAEASQQTAESDQATASPEATAESAPEDRGDAGLEHLAAMPADQQLPAGKWKVGTNYLP